MPPVTMGEEAEFRGPSLPAGGRDYKRPLWSPGVRTQGHGKRMPWPTGATPQGPLCQRRARFGGHVLGRPQAGPYLIWSPGARCP